jgi:hypothetical protein
MIKVLQLILLFLGHAVILLHGIIPHHHHAAVNDACHATGIIFSESQDPFCFNAGADHPDTHEACHFQVIIDRIAFDQVFLKDSHTFCFFNAFKVVIPPAPCLSIFIAQKEHNACAMRAPPALA